MQEKNSEWSQVGTLVKFFFRIVREEENTFDGRAKDYNVFLSRLFDVYCRLERERETNLTSLDWPPRVQSRLKAQRRGGRTHRYLGTETTGVILKVNKKKKHTFKNTKFHKISAQALRTHSQNDTTSRLQFRSVGVVHRENYCHCSRAPVYSHKVAVNYHA